MKAGRARAATLVLLCLSLVACSSQQSRTPGDEPRTPAEINAELGMRYMQQGNLDVALKKLKRALEQDPDLAMAHHYMALLYERYDSTEEAERHFRKALSITPDDPSLKNNYGVFLCGQERYQEAVNIFLEVAKSPYYSRPEEAYENAGLCALRIPDTANAEAYLRLALKFDPLRPVSLFQMARLSYEQGRYFPARGFLQRFERVSPHSAESLLLAVKVEHELENDQAVANYMKMLTDNFPGSAELNEARKVIR